MTRWATHEEGREGVQWEEVNDLVWVGVDPIIIAWLDNEDGGRGEIGDVVAHASWGGDARVWGDQSHPAGEAGHGVEDTETGGQLQRCRP